MQGVGSLALVNCFILLRATSLNSLGVDEKFPYHWHGLYKGHIEELLGDARIRQSADAGSEVSGFAKQSERNVTFLVACSRSLVYTHSN
jgi:hypothetical protein